MLLEEGNSPARMVESECSDQHRPPFPPSSDGRLISHRTRALEKLSLVGKGCSV